MSLNVSPAKGTPNLHKFKTYTDSFQSIKLYNKPVQISNLREVDMPLTGEIMSESNHDAKTLFHSMHQNS